MSKTPKHLDRTAARKMLRALAPVSGVGSRIAAVSERFLGYPYQRCPLIGSADQKEVFTVSLEGFDCVTYVESVLAFARSTTLESFIENLRQIRYSGGVVEWQMRNHYMTDWIRNNQRAGFVRDMTRGRGVVERRRRLGIVDGLPEVRTRVRSMPKRICMRRLATVRTGDLVFFASTRSNLDVFHCGLLVHGDPVKMRHAPLSRGRVIEEDLSVFVARNRMSGIICVRPLDVGPTR